MQTDTKHLIAETLVQLLRKKPADKVTVKDVVEACHISRQTFYYHFQDLMDVMEWTVEQTMQQMLEESMQAETAEQALQILVVTVTERVRTLLPKLLESQHRIRLETLMRKAVHIYLETMIQRRLPEINIAYNDLHVAIDFYSYGIAGLLLEYSMKENLQPEQLTRQIYQMMNGKLLQVVDSGDCNPL